MGRLRTEMLDRVEDFADRVLEVVDTLEKQRRIARVVDQLAGSGTSVGANLFEADQAMTAKDFAKTVCIALKELGETKFWLRLIGRRTWVKQTRLVPLLHETDELLCILNTVVVRTRAKVKNAKSRRV